MMSGGCAPFAVQQLKSQGIYFITPQMSPPYCSFGLRKRTLDSLNGKMSSSIILINNVSPQGDEDCQEIIREDVCGIRLEKSTNSFDGESFLAICTEGDVEDLITFLDEFSHEDKKLTPEILNEPDTSGRVPVSYVCSNGVIEMLEILEDVPGIDYNIPDKEGNTCLHFAAQAGHVQAAIQGRVKCSKLLLFSGASPFRRDYGRSYTPSQWAKFCGRYVCADSIEKFVRSAVPGSIDSSFGDLGGSANDKFKFRSIHNSPRDGSSWLSRKIKKAFTKDDCLRFKKRSDSNAGGGGTDPRSSRKFIIPQLQITPISNNNNASSNPNSKDSHAFTSSSKVTKKKERRIW
ncbi:unnamed protein product [Lepeophtheirus salmonis]|uniref:(salmon louse) hypothetical protein n=2 Tax=Lepeophtheirus salmonis TaxID=72036 RepID=A0A7R8CWS6_LEPSM|nr:unnamed protein product [Lepeophtheirus salmonis]CAF2955718.1 unnamed protein product [Lepeophtheirus salmonis]